MLGQSMFHPQENPENRDKKDQQESEYEIGNLLKAAMLSTISIATGFSRLCTSDNTPQASDEVEDVNTVTATKREQTLEEVPVAVSVTSAAAIERAQVRDLERFADTGSFASRCASYKARLDRFHHPDLVTDRTTPASKARSAFIDGVYHHVPPLQSATFLTCNASKCCVVRSRPCSVKRLCWCYFDRYRCTKPRTGALAEFKGNYNASEAKADITAHHDNIVQSGWRYQQVGRLQVTNLTDGSRTSVTAGLTCAVAGSNLRHQAPLHR
jgi:hypothetical protein